MLFRQFAHKQTQTFAHTLIRKYASLWAERKYLRFDGIFHLKTVE